MKCLILLPLCILFLAFTPFKRSRLIGHWACKNEHYGLEPGDTLSFAKIKYSYNLYIWGGYQAGFEFKKDSAFTEYYNVMCSTESDEVLHYGEKWDLKNGDTIVVISDYRKIFFKILSLKGRKLKLVCLGNNSTDMGNSR